MVISPKWLAVLWYYRVLGDQLHNLNFSELLKGTFFNQTLFVISIHSNNWYWQTDRFREHTEMRQTGVDPRRQNQTWCYITAPGSVSGSLEGGTRAGRGLINECYWVVESLCPHSPLCHWHSQWLHQFVAIITSIGKKGQKRVVKDGGVASAVPSVDSWTLRSDHLGLMCIYIKMKGL